VQCYACTYNLCLCFRCIARDPQQYAPFHFEHSKRPFYRIS
jgi:hypothetical protein